MTDLLADIIVSASIVFASVSWLGGAFGSHVVSSLFR